MINKPINPYPHNCVADTQQDWNFRYDIPNAKFDGHDTVIYELASGNPILMRNESFDSPVSSLNLDIGADWRTEILFEKQDVVLDLNKQCSILFNKNVYYYAGDRISVEIKGNTADGVVSIVGNNRRGLNLKENLLKKNELTFTNVTEENLLIKNDNMPNGLLIEVPVEEVISVNVEVILYRDIKKEYSWDSFYWQKPTNEPDSTQIVSKVDDQTGNIFVRANGEPSETITPTYTVSSIVKTVYDSNSYMLGTPQDAGVNFTYSKSIFNTSCGHVLGDDTSSYCFCNSLEELFGYPCIHIVDKTLIDAISKIGWGKCILEIYNDNGKLVSCTKCLGYDYKKTDANNSSMLYKYFLIIDNENFLSQVYEEFGKLIVGHGRQDYSGYAYNSDFFPYTQARLYNSDALNKQENISGMLECNNQYYRIEKCEYSESEYSYILSTRPVISNFDVGDVISVWSHNSANFNITPTYYFRAKSQPTFSISSDMLSSVDNSSVLNDFKCEFKLNYLIQLYKPNYFYLYLLIYNEQTHEWELKERSPMMYELNATNGYIKTCHTFLGLVNGCSYRAYGVCVDIDGDEWTTEYLDFTVSIPFIPTPNTLATFNAENTSIDIQIGDILNIYKNASLEFYKCRKTETGEITRIDYAGGGICKTGGENGSVDNSTYVQNGTLVLFDKWSDYNIRNDSCYDYYIRVSYTGKNYDLYGNPIDDDCNIIGNDKSKGVEFLLVGSDIYTDFNGTSILGLSRISPTELCITKEFQLFYHFNNDLGELTSELNREYIDSFGKYPKELKGHKNYISGSCSGLLGFEQMGNYVEPKGIRDSWNNFINDESIKFYRGIDGETMIISIETSRVKPFIYPGVGIVNEVNMTFKEIASTEGYVISSTEKTGDYN